MMLADRIKALCENFQGRMKGDLLSLAKSYVDHGENELALDTLCENLLENDIAISEVELAEALSIGKEIGLHDLEYLKNLVH